MQNTIVIVGAGFCGTVLAANLLRRPSSDAIDIVLIERGSAMGRGYPWLSNGASCGACRRTGTHTGAAYRRNWLRASRLCGAAESCR
jgi:2-polyprenyl-6-methoxyphenol hydroxylase-like FAD-dependent oxidoreductase